MFSNADLQTLITQVGKDRINSMSFNNGKYLFIDYESGVKWDDISFKTVGSTDCVVVHHKMNQGGTVLEWDDYLVTEFIENIDILDEGYEKYRIDPLILK